MTWWATSGFLSGARKAIDALDTELLEQQQRARPRRPEPPGQGRDGSHGRARHEQHHEDDDARAASSFPGRRRLSTNAPIERGHHQHGFRMVLSAIWSCRSASSLAEPEDERQLRQFRRLEPPRSVADPAGRAVGTLGHRTVGDRRPGPELPAPGASAVRPRRAAWTAGTGPRRQRRRTRARTTPAAGRRWTSSTHRPRRP